eukprot:153761-Amphidinium_carterae.1
MLRRLKPPPICNVETELSRFPLCNRSVDMRFVHITLRLKSVLREDPCRVAILRHFHCSKNSVTGILSNQRPPQANYVRHKMEFVKQTLTS